MIILGLDMSSVNIGWALLVDGAVERYGHIGIAGEIDARCAQAAVALDGLLGTHRPALVVVESPVGRYPKAVIPQARVSGAALARLAAHAALWHEVEPSVAKKALAGRGDADKREMVEAAAARLGLAGHTEKRNGKVCLVRPDGVILLTEDEADAIGVALAGLGVKVVTKGAA